MKEKLIFFTIILFVLISCGTPTSLETDNSFEEATRESLDYLEGHWKTDQGIVIELTNDIFTTVYDSDYSFSMNIQEVIKSTNGQTYDLLLVSMKNIHDLILEDLELDENTDLRKEPYYIPEDAIDCYKTSFCVQHVRIVISSEDKVTFYKLSNMFYVNKYLGLEGLEDLEGDIAQGLPEEAAKSETTQIYYLTTTWTYIDDEGNNIINIPEDFDGHQYDPIIYKEESKALVYGEYGSSREEIIDTGIEVPLINSKYALEDNIIYNESGSYIGSSHEREGLPSDFPSYININIIVTTTNLFSKPYAEYFDSCQSQIVGKENYIIYKTERL